MKKLTAGILTVMLGIVAANSADASIASKGYVDAQVGAKVSTSDFETFKGTNTTAIEAAKKAGTDASAALETYKTEASNTFATQTALSDGLKTKQNTLKAGTNIEIKDDGTIGTVGIATTEGLNALETTVAGHTTALDKLNGTAETEGSVAKSIADAVASTKTAYEAADATTLQSAKDYADGLAGNYATAAQGAKADTAVQPAAIADMETKTNAAATYATKTALDAKADKSTIGEVETGKTVVEMIADAKTAASGDTTALQARVKTIEDSDVMASGATKAKIDAIATNTAGVADNKAAVAAVTKDLADNYTKTADLGTLAKAAPGACAEPTKKCALVFDGTAYTWEVIERDAENQ